MTTQQRHAQLQAQMTVSLDNLRQSIAIKMIGKIKDMQARPAVKGSDKLPKLGQDSRLHNDETGALLVSAVAGLPGVSGAMDVAVDMAVDSHDAHQAQKRTQDNQVLSFKQIRQIQEDNARDMAAFEEMEKELNLVNTYIMSGYNTGVKINGTLQPLEKAPEQKLEAPTEYRHNNENKIKLAGPRFAA